MVKCDGKWVPETKVGGCSINGDGGRMIVFDPDGHPHALDDFDELDFDFE